MAEHPLVSIVVPPRNAELTLAQALDCLVRQGFADWEAIVVDDGSRDGTAAIIADYVGRDARFRMVRSSAHSAAGARNKGISTRAAVGSCFSMPTIGWTPAFSRICLPR